MEHAPPMSISGAVRARRSESVRPARFISTSCVFETDQRPSRCAASVLIGANCCRAGSVRMPLPNDVQAQAMDLRG